MNPLFNTNWNFSWEVICERFGASTFNFADNKFRSSRYASQTKTKWNSSSTSPSLHMVHTRSSTLVLVYLPVSILRGKIPHLNCAYRDLCARGIYISTYFSVPNSSLKVRYVLSFGFSANLVSHCVSSHSHSFRITFSISLIVMFSLFSDNP